METFEFLAYRLLAQCEHFLVRGRKVAGQLPCGGYRIDDRFRFSRIRAPVSPDRFESVRTSSATTLISPGFTHPPRRFDCHIEREQI